MGRQFRVYLLPADVESPIHTLRSKLEISLIQPSSPRPFPTEMESPLGGGRLTLKTATVRGGRFASMVTEHGPIYEGDSDL